MSDMLLVSHGLPRLISFGHPALVNSLDRRKFQLRIGRRKTLPRPTEQRVICSKLKISRLMSKPAPCFCNLSPGYLGI